MSIIRKIKNMFRKTRFLILCMSSILIFASLIVSYIEIIYINRLEIDNFKTNNHVSFNFDGSAEYKDLWQAIKKLETEKDIIVSHQGGKAFQPEVYPVGIYFNGSYKNGYNIFKGRFLTINDFKNDKKVAVVGKNALSNTKIENGIRYIYRGEDKFEIIGVVGKDNALTRYDNFVLYNINYDFNEKDGQYLRTHWTIDSIVKDKGTLKNIISKINKNKSIIVIQTENLEPNPLKAAISNSRFLIFNFLLIIGCIMISLITAVIYWINEIALEIGVRKAYGASKKDIIINISKRYTLVSIFCLCIALILQRILLTLNIIKIPHSNLSIITIAVTLLFVLLLGIVVIFTAMFKISKINLGELIKGEL